MISKIRRLKRPSIKDIMGITNLLLCLFFGYGFVCSDSTLFKVYGWLFILWGGVYLVYNEVCI